MYYDVTIGHARVSYPYCLALTKSYYGRGNQPSWMNNVRCSGAEKRVEDCAFDGWHEKRCTAQESAGAVCGTYCYRSVATHKIVVPHNVTPPAGAAKSAGTVR